VKPLSDTHPTLWEDSINNEERKQFKDALDGKGYFFCATERQVRNFTVDVKEHERIVADIKSKAYHEGYVHSLRRVKEAIEKLQYDAGECETSMAVTVSALFKELGLDEVKEE
jgi:YHS domain-containing protein